MKTKKNHVEVKKDGREVCHGSAWQERRRAVYERDMGVCQLCLSEIGHAAWDVDHIIGRGLGGGTRNDAMENLQLLHATCHRLVKHK